jgi:putative component of membrane protein insertase Oxa1/YidC/SpoIIIJ protein YidD
VLSVPGLTLKFLKMQVSLIRTIVILCLLPVCLQLHTAGVSAREPATDASLIMMRFEDTPVGQDNHVSFMQFRSERPVLRYNPIALTFGGLMFVYQRFMSPQLPSECLYHPSCSSFSKSLISEYGLVVGVAATADRLMRCNRVAVFDIHPMHLDEVSGKVREEPDIYRKNSE